MKHPEVKHLYKYYAYNANSLSVLINKKIWLAKPESLNDPFECAIKYNTEIPDELFKKYIERTRKENHIKCNTEIHGELFTKDIELTEKEINNIYSSNKQIVIDVIKNIEDELDSNIGIFSMSEKTNSTLMWSHYADKHRGFCIGFARQPDNMLGNIEKTRPVDYKRIFPIIDILDSNGCIDKGIIYKEKYFIKDEDWRYEKEWRFVCDNGGREESLPSAILSIIFGVRMPEQNKNTIRNILADQPGIKFGQAVRSENQFKINSIDFSEWKEA